MAPPVNRRSWERGFEHLVVRFADARRTHVAAAIVVALVAAWALSYASGGMGPPIHAFYVAIIVAATRFGARGAVAVGVIAGAAAGPLLPLDVAEGRPQSPQDWLIRLAFFVVIGLVVALFSRESKQGFGQRIADFATRTELDRALAAGEFHIAYQPQFDLRTGRLLGAEALARWTHPTTGPIAPDTFVPMCERAKVITELDAYVLSQATRQLAEWRQRSCVEARDLWVGVNVCAADLADPDFVDRVRDALRAAGLPPAALHLEITESSVVADIDLAVARVDALRELGVKVAIDDFGTGQSSLAYLHRFHADIIKLDRSFVRAVGDQRVRALVAAVVTLAADLGATTVAEGIETEEDADAVRALGYDAGQGYYYARPSTPEAVTRLLNMAARVPA